MFSEELKNYFGGVNAANDIYDGGFGPVSGQEIANLIMANLDFAVEDDEYEF